MWKFAFALFLFVYLFDRLTSSYCNPYKLIVMFGPKGCGKSTTLSKLAAHDVQSKRVVFTNFGMPGTFPVDPADLGKIDFGRDVSIYIDEGALTWDNRQFKKFDVKTLEWLRLQRHYRTRVYISSQSYDLDAKIRMLADELWIYHRVARVWSVGRRVVKKIKLIDAGKDGQESRIVDNLAYDFPIFPSAWSVTFIPRYVGLFDSFSETMRLNPYNGFLLNGECSAPSLGSSVWSFLKDGFRRCWLDVARVRSRVHAVRVAPEPDLPTDEEVKESLKQSLSDFFRIDDSE